MAKDFSIRNLNIGSLEPEKKKEDRGEKKGGARHTLTVGGATGRGFTSAEFAIQRAPCFADAGAIGEAAASGHRDRCVLTFLLVRMVILLVT